jgi:hypothetical protein
MLCISSLLQDMIGPCNRCEFLAARIGLFIGLGPGYAWLDVASACILRSSVALPHSSIRSAALSEYKDKG